MARSPLSPKHYFTFIAVAAGAAGVTTLLAPRHVLRFFGLPDGDPAQMLLRFFGTDLLFVSVSSARLRDETQPQAIRAFTGSNLVQDSLLAVIAAAGTLSGTMNHRGWLLVGLFGGIAAANALLWTGATSPAEAPEAARG